MKLAGEKINASQYQHQTLVLALRGLSISGAKHSTWSAPSYDDTFVILKDGRATEVPGSTHPGQDTGSIWQGAALIDPGFYKAVPNGPHDGAPSWQILNRNGSDGLQTWRDANQDGRFEPSERHNVSPPATQILLHTGGSTPWSTGCLNVPPSAIGEVANLIGAGSGFNLLLMHA
jgi:hypothetical protein